MSAALAFLPDPALTPLAVEVMQDAEYIADAVSPPVEVDLKSDSYFNFGDLTHLEGVEDTAGEEDDVSEGGFEPTEATYSCKDYGHQMPMSATLLQGSKFFGDDIRQAFTRIASSRVKNKREKRVADIVFDDSLYATSYKGTPSVLWDHATNAVILKDIQDARNKLIGKGQGELILVCGVDVWSAISNNNKILEALKYTSPTGQASRQQVATLMNVSEILVADAKIDATTSYIWGTKHAALLVRSKSPSRFTISAFHSFVLRVNGQTLATYNFADPKKGAHGSEWVKVAYTAHLAAQVCQKAGYHFTDAVA